MKTLSIFSLAVLPLFLNLAQADTNPQTVQDTQEQEAAALNTTRDAINQSLDKIKGGLIKDTFAHADYLAKTAKMEAKIETAMNRFEAVLKNDLLPTFFSVTAAYNNVVTSQLYSDSQKKLMLPGFREQVDKQVPELSARYRLEIQKLYSAGGIDVLGENPREDIQVSCRDERYPTADVSNDADGLKRLYANRIFPALFDGCSSQSCITLSGGDEILLFSLVKEGFDHSISFKLADGSEVTIRGNSGDTCNGYYSNTSSPVIDKKIEEGITLIGDTDNYPAFVKELPFDVNQESLAAAQSKAAALGSQNSAQEAATDRQATAVARQKALQELEGKLVEIGYYYDTDRSSHVTPEITGFCQAYPGQPCMSKDEASNLADNAYNGAKKKRNFKKSENGTNYEDLIKEILNPFTKKQRS